jgi:hypothetical protein
MKTMTMMCPGKGMTPPWKRTTAMSRPRKTQRQQASYASSRLMKTTAGTPMMESTTMMASLATMVPETTAATVAATMMMVMSARFPNQAPQVSQAPTGGRLVSMYQADRLALGAIDCSFVMTSFMNKISLLISCLSKSRFTRSRWQHISSFPNSVDPSLN